MGEHARQIYLWNGAALRLKALFGTSVIKSSGQGPHDLKDLSGSKLEFTKLNSWGRPQKAWRITSLTTIAENHYRVRDLPRVLLIPPRPHLILPNHPTVSSGRALFRSSQESHHSKPEDDSKKSQKKPRNLMENLTSQKMETR